MLRAGRDEGTAAAIAWATVKRAGGKTILGEYGKASVQTGMDTGRLLNSLSPGSPSSVLEPRAGSVRVGSNVAYARHFHAKRPMWPADGADFPKPWLDRLDDILREALVRSLERLLSE